MQVVLLTLWSHVCAGVRSSHPVLWALPRGEHFGASALTTRPAELSSWTWQQQKYLQQQEHLLTLTLALLPVLQELSHLPLQIFHLWATCTANWKVSRYYLLVLLVFLFFCKQDIYCYSFQQLYYYVLLCLSQAHISLHEKCSISLHPEAKNPCPGAVRTLFLLFIMLFINPVCSLFNSKS